MRQKDLLTRAALTLALAVPAAGANAQAIQQETQVAEARREMPFQNVEWRDVRDERNDLHDLRSIRDEWNRAVATRDRVQERVADRRLRDWLQRELREDRGELREARKEAREARAEARRTGLRDDRRDLRVDQHDAARAAADLRVTRRITRELRELQPHFDRQTATTALYARKRRALERLIRLASDEHEMAQREAQEDREEYLEDLDPRRT